MIGLGHRLPCGACTVPCRALPCTALPCPLSRWRLSPPPFLIQKVMSCRARWTPVPSPSLLGVPSPYMSAATRPTCWVWFHSIFSIKLVNCGVRLSKSYRCEINKISYTAGSMPQRPPVLNKRRGSVRQSDNPRSVYDGVGNALERTIIKATLNNSKYSHEQQVICGRPLTAHE